MAVGSHATRRAGVCLGLEQLRAGEIRGFERARELIAPAVGPVLVALAVYLGMLFVLLRLFDFNPTGPIHIGAHLPAERFWNEQTIVERDSAGYDGQWFFYLAHDPALRADDPYAFLDFPAYRYARVLYPTLVWASSLGRPDAIPWALLVVNVIGALAGTIAAVDILRSLGASRWLALAFALSPAILIGLATDLAEPTAFALVAAGVALYLRRRHGWAGLVLGVGALAREVSALVPLAFAAHAAMRKNWREAAAYSMPLMIPIGWHCWIWMRLGALPFVEAPHNFGLPLSGAVYRAGFLLGIQPPLLGEPAPFRNVSLEVTVIGVSIAIMLVGLTKVLRRRDVFAVQLSVHSALGLFTGPLVWTDLFSFARVLGLLYLFYGLALLPAPRDVLARAGRTAEAKHLAS